MARLRNLSTSLLKPFQSSNDQQHSRSVSQPLSLQRPRDQSPNSNNNNNNNNITREKPVASPTARESAATTPTHERTPTRQREFSSASRPTSMVYGYGTAASDMARGDIEELLPVFSYLSSHSNKLYQEGYFLKLNDLDTNGKPNADRSWMECFAQLVGTVLSLWDAAALDAAGQDGEVAPTFINLADASIKMIETLPTRNQDVQPLQNVLSISTAGKNRYLLHFNSLHSLTQWTAGIRLAMFEHSSLHELYTGSLIAGRGKHLNNIKAIMEKTKFRQEDWARVRFGAGTPWRRCWAVIDPPDEKEVAKTQKSLKKSRSPYERPHHPRGSIKFYDTKKTKKAMPIATITDAYAAYAIYPQAKPLIDQSTLVKVEGKITIHSKPESRTEGFVFVMPEVHPAVSGFEIMLRWLFPVFDIFTLYGRPERLIADRGATNGLMFAMPQERRYGYLDIIDVAALIHTDGSDKWSEREWRKRMKEATRSRMDVVGGGRSSGNLGNRRGPSASFGSRNGVRYEDNASIRSQPSTRHQYNQSTDAVSDIPKRPNVASPGQTLMPSQTHHNRSVSESVAFPSSSKNRRQDQPPRLSTERQVSALSDAPPVPRKREPYWNGRQAELDQMDSKNSSDSDLGQPQSNAEQINREAGELAPPGPVIAPPTMTHNPGDRPQTRPNVMPELRREKSRMSTATLSQLVDASKNPATGSAAAGAMAAWSTRDARDVSRGDNQSPRGVGETPNDRGMPANQSLDSGLVAGYSESPTVVTATERSASAHSIKRKPVSRSSSSHSATRKPVSGQAPPVPQLDGSTLGLATDASMLSVPSMQRQPSGNSNYSNSEYDRDEDSEGNPFADTHRVERPRTGVLKTVGDPRLDDGTSRSDIPGVDFGPTRQLTPNVSRPGTSGSPAGRKMPSNRMATPERDTQSPSRSPVAWQPGNGRQSPGPALSPEEFVQQRSAAARVPNGYVPYRSHTQVDRPPNRNSLVRGQTMRTPSQDWSDQNAAVPRPQSPAQQAAQRAYNYSLQQQQPPRRQGPGHEQLSYNYPQQQSHGFHQATTQPIQQQQALSYSYGQDQHQQQGWSIDAQQSGQWVSPQAQAYWGGANSRQQQNLQGQWQHQQQQQQQRSQYSGFYPPEQAKGR